jgi:tetratricopeptide (TPR) repeat protein
MSLKIDRGLFKYDFTDYHAILCVPINADVKEIRKRYLKIARRLHPDSCTATSNAEKQLASDLLSKLVNPAYERLSQEKNRAEYMLVLLQTGKRLLQESTSIDLTSDVAKQLAQTSHLEQAYKSAIALLAETQYDSLDNVLQTIGLISEANLVYLVRNVAVSKPVANPTPTPTPATNTATPSKVNQTTAPPVKEDSMVAQYIRRSQDLLAKNQLAQAEVELRDALKLEPNNSRCHSLIAMVYLKQNQIKMAKVHFHRALQLDPQDQIALEGQHTIEKILGQKSASSKSAAKSGTGTNKAGKSHGGGLFGGLFGGKKK